MKDKANANAAIDRAKELQLDNKVKRWEYVEKRLSESTSLEVHVRAVVAGLIVIGDLVDELGLSEPPK